MSLQKNLSGIFNFDKPILNLEKKDVKTINLKKSSIDLEKKKQIGNEVASEDIAGYFDGDDAELFEQVKELTSYQDMGLNTCINDVRTLRNIKQEVKDTMIGAARRPMTEYSKNLLEHQLNCAVGKYISNGDIYAAKIDVNLSWPDVMVADIKLKTYPYSEYITLSFEVKD